MWVISLESGRQRGAIAPLDSGMPQLGVGELVGRVGIEPTTPGLKVRCSAS